MPDDNEVRAEAQLAAPAERDEVAAHARAAIHSLTAIMMSKLMTDRRQRFVEVARLCGLAQGIQKETGSRVADFEDEDEDDLRLGGVGEYLGGPYVGGVGGARLRGIRRAPEFNDRVARERELFMMLQPLVELAPQMIKAQIKNTEQGTRNSETSYISSTAFALTSLIDARAKMKKAKIDTAAIDARIAELSASLKPSEEKGSQHEVVSADVLRGHIPRPGGEPPEPVSRDRGEARADGTAGDGPPAQGGAR